MTAKGQTDRELSTAEVARMAGVHRDTLLRWLRRGLIEEPRRDRRGWRVFSPDEAEKVVSFSNGTESGPRRGTFRPPSEGAERFARLRAIDWDFADAKTTYLTHGIHPYPAKFIPQIPNALIQELSSVGDTVADIFCGSGTTLVEALLLKRHAVGIDANPIACLISRAKTTALQPGDTELLFDLSERAGSLGNSIALHSEANLFGKRPFTSSAPRPSSDAVTFWFEPFVIEELAEILSWCNLLASDTAKVIALVAFSSVVVAVSKQDSDTRYVRRKKNIVPGDTARRFAGALTQAVNVSQEFTELVEPRFSRRVYQENILERPDIGQVDLVVCSPPYPNAYSYHLYHMTRMLWLGMDQPTFKKQEIGSHRKYSRKGRNGADAETFRQEMALVFDWLRTTLRRGRYACFVVGNSTIRGELVDNTALISQVAQDYRFRKSASIPRRMQDSKKSFNPSIGKIKGEEILVFENEA